MKTAYRESHSKRGWHFPSKTMLLCPSESNHKNLDTCACRPDIWEWLTTMGDADHVPEGPGAGEDNCFREGDPRRPLVVPDAGQTSLGGPLECASLV